MLSPTSLSFLGKRENFRCTSSSIGVQSQLSTLSQIIRTVDPKLHQHLGKALLRSGMLSFGITFTLTCRS